MFGFYQRWNASIFILIRINILIQIVSMFVICLCNVMTIQVLKRRVDWYIEADFERSLLSVL